jgi:hypothetical protein
VSGHSLKLHFCLFERSQGNHNNLDYHNVFWNIFYELQSLHVQRLIQIKYVFTCSKHLNLESGQSLFFSDIFFSTNCAPILLKIVEDFNIDD